MSTRRILFTPNAERAKTITSPRAKEILNSLGEVIWNETGKDYTSEQLAELVPGVDAVVTSWGSPELTPEVIAKADKLRIVGHAAGSVKRLMGKDGYDRGIVMLSAAPVIADSVAEYTIWAMLRLQRELDTYEQVMKVERGWKSADQGFSHELYYKKVGIVSASMVGRRVMRLLGPWGCDIMLYDPYVSPEDAKKLGARLVSLEELFSTADIVSVHAPSTPETKKMITADHFRSMRDGARFVNTARTWVLDEPAMVEELRRGRINAVIDVFDQEPLPADHPLRDLPNVFITPHVSGHTTESRMRLVESIAQDMARFFAGEQVQMAVTWERLKIMA